jgi:DnaJ-class molecular chaperone
VISFYETLEVSPRASNCVIRAAYRSLAQHHHPDKNPGASDAGTRLISINQAYAVLSDPAHRLSYDRALALAGGFDDRRGWGLSARKSSDPAGEVHASSRPFGFRQLDPLSRQDERL